MPLSLRLALVALLLSPAASLPRSSFAAEPPKAPSSAATPPPTLEQLLVRLPEAANAVALVKIRSLLDSPLGKAEKWSAEHRESYAAGIFSAPPWVDLVVRATEFRPHSAHSPGAYALYVANRNTSMGEIAKHERAPIEKFGDLFAVRSPRDVYFVGLAPKLLASVQPADRQLVARWIRGGQQAVSAASPSYTQMALRSTGEAQVVLALDLADSLEPDGVGRWLKGAPFAKNLTEADAQSLAELLASIRGLRLAVLVTDTIRGRLRVEFSQEIGQRGAIVQQAVLEVFDEMGARMEILSKAQATVDGHSLVLDAPLDQLALRRLINLIRSPQPETALSQPSSADAPNPLASVRYYDAVLQDVWNLNRLNRRASDYTKTALWHESCAQQIESLSTLAVDPALTEWSYRIATQMRALAGSLRGVPTDLASLERSIRTNVRTIYVPYAATPFGSLYRPGPTTVNSNANDVRARQAEVVAKDAENREHIWRSMHDDTAAVAKQMTDKYQTPFAPPK